MQGLSEAKITEFREAFNLFDKDGNGIITAAELGIVMRGLGQNPTEQDLKEMIDDVDLDADGLVKFDEFCHLMLRQMEGNQDQEQALREAFKMFDRDGNGFISADELKTAMCNLGQKLDDDEVMALIKEADLNGDGMVHFEEFLAMMMGLPT